MELHRALIDAVRAACPSALWAKGGRLWQAGAVRGLSRCGDEWEARVAVAGRAVEVVLFPQEQEWSCECDGRFDCCEHVAAAAQALADGGAVAVEDAGRLVVRLRRRDGGLAARCVWCLGDGREAPPGDAPLTARDEAVRQALVGTDPDRPLPGPRLAPLLDALRGGAEVTLDGVAVTVEAPTAALRVVVRDDPDSDGVRVRIVRERGVTETFTGGAALCRGALRRLRGHGLAPGLFRALSAGRVVPRGELGALASELLPRLRRQLPVVLRTDRVAGSTSARPRLELSARGRGGALELETRIVYGTPPVLAVEGERVEVLREGVPIPRRRPEWERKLKDRAAFRLEVPVGEPVRLETAAAVRRAASLRAAAEDDPDLVVRGGGLQAFRVFGELVPELDAEGGVRFVTTTGARADLEAVRSAHDRADPLVPLLDGGFARAPAGFMAEHGDLVVQLLAAKAQGADPGAGALARARACAALGVPAPEELAPWMRLVAGEAAGGAALPAPELPQDLRATLRPYQERGVRWLAAHRELQLGALLADDMGLGKTVQALAVLEGRCLVVAPTSVLASWVEQAQRFRPGLSICLYHGPHRRLDPAAELVITSWALLRRDIDRLAQGRWDAVVLDESHVMKNPDSQVARAARRLRAGFRLALSGTPVENRLDDLWSQLAFLVPGAFGALEEFRRRYRPDDPHGRAQLERRLHPLVLRRRKADVAADLPARTELVLRCELSAPERAVYDAVLAATRRDAAARAGAGPLAMLEALLRLRQSACHPALVPGHGATEGGSAKLRVLVERLVEAREQGHRALVFSQWTGLLDLVEPALRGVGLEFARLDGSTKDRGQVVRSFQADDGPPVMLVSLKAGGTGLTLTAADHVFLLDPWWNPAVEDQAADRAHRIGQRRAVIIHRLVATDTIDEAILALQARKRALAGDLLDTAAGALTVDDLRGLLA